MKRILIILPNLDLGGMENSLMNYFRRFKRVVFDFTVHGENGVYEDEACAMGAKIFRAPTRSQGFFKNIFAMRKIYKENDYDFVIVCTEHAFAFIELLVAWLCGVKKRGAWSHFSDYQGRSRLKRCFHFIARPFLRLFTNEFFACSKGAGCWLFGKKILHRKNFYVINNAIDLEKFKFNPQAREETRAKHGIGDKFAIGIVGRLMPVKNHAFALEVIHACGDDAVLLIIGDGELRRELEARASENVIFTGAVSNVADYFHALDALIIPSFHEGLVLVAIEAQASGLNVLLSDTVSTDTKIGGTAYFKSLNDGAEAWAKEIFNLKPADRSSVDLKKSGYNIAYEAEKLEKILCDT